MLPDNRKRLPCNASCMIVYYRENIESVIALFDKTSCNLIWDKVFKDGPSKIYGRQPLKILKRCGLLKLNQRVYKNEMYICSIELES